MLVYAGIDEAGYGPQLGPMVVGRSVWCVPKLDGDAELPNLWQRLRKAVCRGVAEGGRMGGSGGGGWRIPVNDSKKLTSRAAGLRHLELGCLTFAQLAGKRVAAVDQWIEAMGAEVSQLPWYEPTDDRPWQALPGCHTFGQIAVAANMLAATAGRIGVEVRDVAAAVVCEDRFNDLVGRTHNKAAVNFHCVARHIDHIWRTFGQHSPVVCVDRQGGRTRYRELLQQSFPDAHLTVLDETEERSAYHLREGAKAMTVHFQVAAEQRHMPVALASMLSKYTRELLMQRFNGWWCGQVDGLAPTAGYAKDARRWLAQVQGELGRLGVAETALRRRQ